jgi:hypothetical protein
MSREEEGGKEEVDEEGSLPATEGHLVTGSLTNGTPSGAGKVSNKISSTVAAHPGAPSPQYNWDRQSWCISSKLEILNEAAMSTIDCKIFMYVVLNTFSWGSTPGHMTPNLMMFIP